MSTITLYTKSHLEGALLTVSGEDPAFPAARLRDRAISLFWQHTATAAVEIKADQGAGAQTVDFLAIPRHNFAGCAMAWQYSADDFAADIHDAAPGWTQGDGAAIVRVLPSPVTARYWRVTVASLVNPRCSEVFISFGRSFEVMAAPSPRGRRAANVIWHTTVGGQERSTKRGDRRRERTYTLFASPAELETLRAALDDLNEQSLPFYLRDDEGAYWPCRLQEEPPESFDHKTHTRVVLSFLEML